MTTTMVRKRSHGKLYQNLATPHLALVIQSISKREIRFVGHYVVNGSGTEGNQSPLPLMDLEISLL